MKLLVVVAALTSLCSANAFPGIPGNDSFNLAKTSRYAWIPNDAGVLHLVDFYMPIDESLIVARSGNNNQYWLYTRKNPDEYQLLVHHDSASISRSNYHPSRPLNVIVHGWTHKGESRFIPIIRDSFLAVQDANVIVVDWKDCANMLYPIAAWAVPNVGRYLGDFLMWLIKTAGGDWNKVHLVGYSLGAHVIGCAGRTTGGYPARITGLDPAGPAWANNIHALNKESARYVEAIHTDCGVLGSCMALDHADFYVNGGSNPQPNCWLNSCSHARSTQLFAATVQYNHIVGRQCHSFEEATSKVPCCYGKELKLGNADFTKCGYGLYQATTTGTWPF